MENFIGTGKATLWLLLCVGLALVLLGSAVLYSALSSIKRSISIDGITFSSLRLAR